MWFRYWSSRRTGGWENWTTNRAGSPKHMWNLLEKMRVQSKYLLMCGSLLFLRHQQLFPSWIWIQNLKSFIALEMETLTVILVSDNTNKPHWEWFFFFPFLLGDTFFLKLYCNEIRSLKSNSGCKNVNIWFIMVYSLKMTLITISLLLPSLYICIKGENTSLLV